MGSVADGMCVRLALHVFFLFVARVGNCDLNLEGQDVFPLKGGHIALVNHRVAGPHLEHLKHMRPTFRGGKKIGW